MEKLARWMVKNRLLAKILGAAFLCGAYTFMLLDLGAPLWVVLPVDAVLLFMIHTLVDTAGGRLLKKPLEHLDKLCDPYPFLNEVQEQLRCKCSPLVMQTLQINYAVGLRHIGKWEEALTVLQGIHIDRYSGTLPATKVVYYNNLSDLMNLLGQQEAAQIWYQKSAQIYRDMPESRVKRQLERTLRIAYAESCMRQGAYDQARVCLDSLPERPLRSQVDTALIYGRCCIALGDIQSAKNALNFVVEKGNLLYCVEQAKALLKEL